MDTRIGCACVGGGEYMGESVLSFHFSVDVKFL